MQVVSVLSALLFTMAGSAQTPATAKPAAAAQAQPAAQAKPAAPAQAKPAAPAQAKPAAPAAARAASYKVEAPNLALLMRGILFPNSNIIFDAQNNDPATKKEEGQFSAVYGGWQAVENAALALAESANLLMIPGRVCSNGKPVPMNRADWPKFVQLLRDASQASYKAAQSKNMDNIVDAAGALTEACSACHDVYREKPNLSLRCTP
jgi:hypothetical protein